jgi:isopropylmalate/homocitrate/citramalate synthase
MRMAVAAVTFARSSSGVRLTLTVEGALAFEGSNVTQMVREVAVRGVTELRLTNTYSVKAPTNCDTLSEAAKQRLDEPLAAFILISECAW